MEKKQLSVNFVPSPQFISQWSAIKIRMKLKRATTISIIIPGELPAHFAAIHMINLLCIILLSNYPRFLFAK
jgi:hypothetical protein